jgi:hypothetical protein
MGNQYSFLIKIFLVDALIPKQKSNSQAVLSQPENFLERFFGLNQ